MRGMCFTVSGLGQYYYYSYCILQGTSTLTNIMIGRVRVHTWTTFRWKNAWVCVAMAMVISYFESKIHVSNNTGHVTTKVLTPEGTPQALQKQLATVSDAMYFYE